MPPFLQHQVALDVAARLMRGNTLGVAVTGSVGRGQPGPHSDVDLWVLGHLDGRHHFFHRGVPVTLLLQTPEHAASLDNLCFYDVDDLWVLHDPHGHFARIRRRYALERARIHASIVAASREAILDASEHALIGSSWHRLMHLRELAWRVACLHVFATYGGRVPKLRHLQALLPPHAFHDLTAALGLPREPRAWTRFLTAWERASASLIRACGGRRHAPHLVQEPARLAALRRHHAEGDAVLHARRILEEALQEPLHRHGRWDPARLPSVVLKGTWMTSLRAAHGTLEMEPDDIRATRPTAQRVESLCRALRTAQLYDDARGMRALWRAAARAG
ncbi:MAG: hypothetical protein AB2A00_01870 [Myxococcota bacterium]